MKKLFTLLTLLVALVTSAWGASPTDPTSSDFTAAKAFAATELIYTNSQYSADPANWATGWVVCGKSSARTSFSVANSKSHYLNPVNDTYSSTSLGNVNGINLKSGNDQKTLYFYVTNVTQVEAYITANGGTTGGLKLSVVGDATKNATASLAEGALSVKATLSGLTATTTYIIKLEGTTSTDSPVYAIRFTAGIPTLTGTWKVGDDVVTGQTTNIVKDAAATAPTFVVGASAGTPTTDDYTVAYSLKAGSKAGIFTYTAAGGVSAINTSVEGTATIVATLTTKDAKKFQTPATNTFEYTVTIAAAAAPVFTVTGSESAVRGDALQLTANVTAGNPTPTIQWFSSDDDASITNPEAQGEAGTDKLTFDVPTTDVGIYYYYAVANNGIGGDGDHDVFSNIMTITVKPKSPTITSSVKFGSSVKVFIKKADGEDAEAVIKYKKGNGEWLDYPDGDAGIELSATTTVYAKVVQSDLGTDIESAVVSATYTKVAVSAQTNVTDLTTWDWSTVTNASDIEVSQIDMTYDHLAALGYTALTAPAAFNKTALLINGQYAYRNANSSKFFQGNYMKFNTTVAGKVTIEYANTGGNAARTVNVNGTKGSKSSTSNTGYQEETFDVADGTVTIKGVQVSDDADKMLRIRKVTFIPTGATVPASFAAGKEYITFASPYALDCTTDNLPAGLKAYKATGVSASSVTIEEVNATVAAGTGLLLQRTGDTSAAGNFNIPVVATGTNISGTNKFVGVTAAAGAAIGGDGVYDYVLKDGQFHHASSGTLAQGKAYLHLDAAPAAPVLTIDFGDVTGISQIENGELIIENVYDLQGRKVAQPTKGLYIVNGRKVVIK